MEQKIIVTILPSTPQVKTSLVQPLVIQTRLANGQGPAGESMDNFNGNPLAYYILAKS